MNPQFIVMIGAGMVALMTLLLMLVILSGYRKVGSNEVMIISGRRVQLPDGRVIGFRIVKGGGTFVWPLLEKVDVLSLEVFTVELPRLRVAVGGGGWFEGDGLAQVKINGDDAAIMAVAEHFLSKSQDEIKRLVRPVLEKHLNSVVESSSAEEAAQNPAAYAAKVQASASADLGRMGASLVSFTLRNAR